MGEHATGDHPQRASPTRRERDRDRRLDQGSAARLASGAAGRARSEDPDRPHARHPRVGPRRRARARARGRARRARDPRVLAQPPRDADREPRGADLDRRLVRRHVPDGLQPEQPVADGAHDRNRLRRRRRDRDDREHRTLSRGRRQTAPGRAQGRAADRLHDHFVDRVADRRADSALVHERRRRATVPRVRRDARDDDRDLGRRIADAHCVAVGALAEARPARGGTKRRAAHTLRRARRQLAQRFRARDRSLRQHAALGARPPAAGARDRRCDARAHGAALRRDPEGTVPDARHGTDPSGSPRARIGVVRGDGRDPAVDRGKDPRGPRRRKLELVHRRGRLELDRALERPNADQPEAARRARRAAGHHGPLEDRSVRGARHAALSATRAGSHDRRRDRARPSTGSRCKARIPSRSRRGATGSRPRCRTSPRSRTSSRIRPRTGSR